ncbi:hypothetical protein SAMN02745216_03822 [Desulfatibacillum alkenivorans DSM 16219]|jgi:hypothetical protein|uniref:Double Cache domain-containing protein n=1 Tax=Desulfatibacillum alkenivorans DSM 16219 TaxID=1121393 RepID=A0A1M6U5F1_9BACT|nr:cache domain-containing protein [Desulfatibacillum alkenivorans]SHK64417.1 hypothetical protein SAMN02745216_03822 [Desulfatibacillum alkenivorans DSM 16219]
MKKVFTIVLVCLMLFCLAGPAAAQESATPQEVYDMVLKAAYLLEQLGEDGLPAFNDPQGEFAWKDSYVFVTDCSQGIVAAHPNPQAIGLTTDITRCKKTGALILQDACELAAANKVKTHGVWREYWWDRAGFDEPQRKLSFFIPVPNSTYQVGSGIYNDKTTLEELNSMTR